MKNYQEKRDSNEKSITKEIKIPRCYGCGVILQSTNPNELGYVREDKLSIDEDCLCERCYKLRHYGEIPESSPKFNEDYIKLLTKAKDSDSLIVFVVDCFFIETSMIEELTKNLGKKVLVLLNKKDILPRDFPEEKLIGKIENILKADNINPIDILLVSSSKNINIDAMLQEIEKYRDGKDVYFVGASNVGKSSIINKLLSKFENKTNKLITTSQYPGTTLNLISIPLDEHSYIYDTPGIYNPHSIYSQVEKSILKFIIPRHQVRVRNFQCKPERSLIIGGLARIDIVSVDKKDKGKTNISAFVSNEVDIENVSLKKADKSFTSFITQENITPISRSISEINDLERHEFILPIVDENTTVSITIVGLGQFMTSGKGQTIHVYAPKHVTVKLEVINYRV